MGSLWLLLGGCGGGTPSVPSEPSLRGVLDADSAGLGDPVTLSLSVILPAAATPVLPGEGDSLGAWKVLGRSPVNTTRSGEWVRYDREITIAGYRLGSIGPDSLVAWGALPGADSLRLVYAPPRLRITGKIGPEEQVDPSAARDIRDVLATGPVRWPWFVAGGIVLAGAAFLLWRRLRSRRRAGPGALAPPGPTPEEEFERAIERLLAAGLLELGLFREFYYEVSSAVRLYLERVHGLPLLESTSSEVVDLLERRMEGAAERSALRDWLIEGDLVKYARMERLQAEARNYLDRSLRLVRLLSGRPTDSTPPPPPDPTMVTTSGGPGR